MLLTAYLATAVLALAGAPQNRCASELLDVAVRQAAEGSYEESLASLNRTIHELEGRGPAAGCSATLAQAHLRSGVAYVGLDQLGLARAAFLRALGYDRSLRPSEEEFPAKVLRVWTAAQAMHSETRSFERSARRKGHRTALVIVGLGAAAGGLSAATVRSSVKERDNLAPTAQILEHRPEGVPIAQVTRVTFFGSASDPDGEALALKWTFGCGAAGGAGATVTVVFPQGGTCSVKLSATDGLGATASAETTVTVGVLTGTWVPTTPTLCELRSLSINSLDSSSLKVGLEAANSAGLRSVSVGFLLPPRGLYLEHGIIDSASTGQCIETYSLVASADLSTLSGTDECTDAAWRSQYTPRVGQKRSVTFTRQ